jgi:hypothetical protein
MQTTNDISLREVSLREMARIEEKLREGTPETKTKRDNRLPAFLIMGIGIVLLILGIGLLFAVGTILLLNSPAPLL